MTRHIKLKTHSTITFSWEFQHSRKLTRTSHALPLGTTFLQQGAFLPSHRQLTSLTSEASYGVQTFHKINVTNDTKYVCLSKCNCALELNAHTENTERAFPADSLSRRSHLLWQNLPQPKQSRGPQFREQHFCSRSLPSDFGAVHRSKKHLE